MSRYFDLDDERIVYDRNSGEYAIYCVPLDMQPADVVEVVRCKDCIFHHVYKNGKYYVCPLLDAVFERDNFFCAYGIKNDDSNTNINKYAEHDISKLIKLREMEDNDEADN